MIQVHYDYGDLNEVGRATTIKAKGVLDVARNGDDNDDVTDDDDDTRRWT